MLIYLVFFATLILLRFTVGSSPAKSRIIYPYALLAVFIFSAFRFEVGCDWSGYLNHWIIATYGQPSAIPERDIVWWGALRLLGNLKLDYHWLQFLVSGIFFFGFHKLAIRQKDPLGFLILAFPILILNMPMSALRQAIAIGIMCLAYRSFIDKSTRSYICWVLLASLVHSSAAVFILLAPLVGGRFDFNRMIIAAMLAIPGLALLLTSGQADIAVVRYVESDTEAAGAIFRIGLLVLTAVVYFLVFRKRWAALYPDDYRLVTLISLMSLLLVPLLLMSSVIADRFGYYLVPVQAMLLARIPYLGFQRGKLLFATAPYLALFAILTVWVMTSSHFARCYVPYQTWMSGKPTIMRYPY